jgi:death on curing protein
MIERLEIATIIALHAKVIAASGGYPGIRDENLLDSALAQPFMTFGGELIYATVSEQASALAFSMVNNHPFLDGNKRIAHAAMTLYLHECGWKISASIDEQETLFLSLASGTVGREELVSWIENHIKRI